MYANLLRALFPCIVSSIAIIASRFTAPFQVWSSAIISRNFPNRMLICRFFTTKMGACLHVKRLRVSISYRSAWLFMNFALKYPLQFWIWKSIKNSSKNDVASSFHFASSITHNCAYWFWCLPEKVAADRTLNTGNKASMHQWISTYELFHLTGHGSYCRQPFVWLSLYQSRHFSPPQGVWDL